MSALADKKIIVTGGGRGIGKAIARAFLREGASVLLVSRTQRDLEAAKEEFSEISKKTFVCAADVSKPDDVARVKAHIERDLAGMLDILVNAAGIYGPKGPLDTLTQSELEQWGTTFAVNVFGTMRMCHLAIPFMKRAGGGRIVNFTGGGEGPFPNFTAYSASKGAILRFNESLAAEVRSHHIWVNAIAPGAVNTKLLEELLAVGPEKVGKEFYEKSLKQKEEGGISPEKAAALVLFLASEKSEGITGRVFSAVWDDLDSVAAHKDEIMQSDIFTSRRIKPSDRHKNW